MYMWKTHAQRQHCFQVALNVIKNIKLMDLCVCVL